MVHLSSCCVHQLHGVGCKAHLSGFSFRFWAVNLHYQRFGCEQEFRFGAATEAIVQARLGRNARHPKALQKCTLTAS